MIVYGDPHDAASLGTLLARLQARLSTLRHNAATLRPTLDELRTLLIQAGQLEQAAHDAAPQQLPPVAAHRLVTQCQSVTDSAATAFLGRWATSQDGALMPGTDVADSLASLAAALDCIQLPDLRLIVKLPEGFAFYALYPEQYCAATLRWLSSQEKEKRHEAALVGRASVPAVGAADLKGCGPAAHGGHGGPPHHTLLHFPDYLDGHATSAPGQVVVIGIRSIGTTLSAVVTAALIAGGWNAHRLTVRPTGDPFARTVDINPCDIGAAGWSLVVDEGPGLSGSSMAAVAAALQRAGLARERISFFPGHAGDPGSKATAETRAWWHSTPRYVTSLDALRWHGRSLPEVLADLTPALCHTNEPVERIEDLSGGQWRQFVYPAAAAWPAVAAPFECPKYRCVLRDGTAVLWKFGGLATLPDGDGNAAETMRATLTTRAANGWTIAPLGVAEGFVAIPWLTGEPLTRVDVTPALLSHIGRYITAVRSPALSDVEHDAALERLRHMLYWNVHEALGENFAERAQADCESARQWARDTMPATYGDGRLAPHEWRCVDGQFFKLDSWGHDRDHTIIGQQPWVWDVAGAMSEWGLDETTAMPLLDVLQNSGKSAIPGPVLRFYRLAYAAWRMGLCAQCAAMSHEPMEQARLHRAGALYRDELARLLSSSTC